MCFGITLVSKIAFFKSLTFTASDLTATATVRERIFSIRLAPSLFLKPARDEGSIGKFY